MKTVNDILRDYRSADAGARLEMYLFYRDLREEFTALEMELVKQEAAKEKGTASLIRRFCLPRFLWSQS